MSGYRKYFSYAHLPADKQTVSAPFGNLAAFFIDYLITGKASDIEDYHQLCIFAYEALKALNNNTQKHLAFTYFHKAVCSSPYNELKMANFEKKSVEEKFLPFDYLVREKSTPQELLNFLLIAKDAAVRTTIA